MTDTILISSDDALNEVHTAMFRLQNALRAPATSVGETFPLAEGTNKAGFEKELSKFEGLTLNKLLYQAATHPGDARDFCGKAAIKYWVFEGLNPFEVLFPFYKQMFGIR